MGNYVPFSGTFGLIVWSCILIMDDCYGIEGDETRLIKKLMKDYDSDARPVKHQSNSVKVHLNLIYKELKEMDEPNQSMESLMWFRIKWEDVSLQWNESEYGGISTIRLDPSRVWKPDLTLYNSVHKNGNLYSFKTRPIISSNGSLNWLAHTILKTTCKLDISKFPFDDQKCMLKIGSWTYHSFALDLDFSKQKESLTAEETYTENKEWELLSVHIKKNTETYSCCPEPYQDLTYTFHFRRKPWYYITSIVFPCIVLSLLASISFLFPAESGERVSLVFSVLLGLTVFMLIVNDKTPVTSDGTPMITQYFTAIWFATFLILLATAFILRMHHVSPSRPVPYYLESLRDFFACVLCMRTSLHDAARQNDFDAVLFVNAARLSYLRELKAMSQNGQSVNTIVHQLERFAVRQEEDDLINQMKEDWQWTAKVFDRLFFLIFVLVFIILNIYVFSFF